MVVHKVDCNFAQQLQTIFIMKKTTFSIVAAVGIIAAILFTALSQYRAAAGICRVLFSGVWYSCNDDPEHICTAVLEDGELRICLGEAASPDQGDIQP